MNIIESKKEQFKDAINHLKKELQGIRSGRATPALVDNIMVDYYGTKTPLPQLATISAPDPRSIVIQPWDKNVSSDIEKGIRASSLDINPVNEGDQIRLPIPPLTEERRKELVKTVNQKVEQTKISIRNVREDIGKEIKHQKSEGKISEDDMYAQQKELQRVVDEYNQLIEEIAEKKEKEIMSV